MSTFLSSLHLPNPLNLSESATRHSGVNCFKKFGEIIGVKQKCTEIAFQREQIHKLKKYFEVMESGTL